MARLLLVRPGAGAPDLLPLEAWRALTTAPAFCAPGDDLAERLRDAGYRVEELDVGDDGAADVSPPPLKGRSLLAPHQHGAVSEGVRALAERLVDLAVEHGEIAFIAGDEAVVRAAMERALRGDVELEVVVGRYPRGHRLLELVKVMARLRGPGGCPWDAEQTHETLAKHLLDETYELLDAIERGDVRLLAEELGDVLLQVVFHAQMAADAGTFDVDDVSEGLVAKLVRRHPHVFGDVEVSGAGEVVANWDAIKQDEKPGRDSALDGIPDALPALAYAQKVQRRAAAAGFDWRKSTDALAKVREEAEELARETEPDRREEELGDLLFSLVALGRRLDVDAETALRRAARRFGERFRDVERAARDRGVGLDELADEELDRLWQTAKER